MKNVLMVLLLVIIFSCEERKPKEIEYTQKVLIAKTIEEVSGDAFNRGYTRHLLAFNDGHTENTSFGYYSCLQIGDTVDFTREVGGWYWHMKPNCK